jgi:glycosyltransferase involved in cell wall biosynthesis
MSKPLLTVCLITYNQASYIKQSIDTILSQEVNFDWELIIADDYSTDGTRKILLEYKEKHPDLIRLILQVKNVGPETNWLDLMSLPKTKYVLYADGDDYFTDNQKLQKQVDFLESHHDVSICFHPVKVIYQDGSRPDEIFPTAEQRFNKETLESKDLITNNFIQTNSAMYRWRFIKDNIRDHFPLNVAPGDWFLHILHADSGKIGFIDRTMSVYRKHPGGLWWDSSNNKDEFWKKYGLPRLKFYMELMNRYGEKPEYRKIIESSVINLLNSFVRTDETQNSGLFNKAVSSLPEAADIYINNLREQVEDIRSHADEQAKIISHYVDLSQELAHKSEHLQSENNRLEHKMLLRLEGAVKRRIKRKST